MKWGYKVIIEDMSIYQLIEILNINGKLGWELVNNVVTDSSMFSKTYVLIFKKVL